MKAKTNVVPAGHRRHGVAVQVLRTDEHLEIWRCEDGARRTLTGTVNVALATETLAVLAQTQCKYMRSCSIRAWREPVTSTSLGPLPSRSWSPSR